MFQNTFMSKSSLETCVICNNDNASILCCDLYFCLLDFLTSLHSAHFEKARIVNNQQFNKDAVICDQVVLKLVRNV